MSVTMWAVWALVLILQNFAFTFVSRARNSGSLRRHMVASVFSNGVWFISQVLIFSTMFKMMTGQFGIKAAIFTGAYYTAFTMAGSLLAHYASLKTEKGKGAVGASAKYHQVTNREWYHIEKIIGALREHLPLHGVYDTKVDDPFTCSGTKVLHTLIFKEKLTGEATAYLANPASLMYPPFTAAEGENIRQMLTTFHKVVKQESGYVPLPQAPKASQGEGGRVIKSGGCVA